MEKFFDTGKVVSTFGKGTLPASGHPYLIVFGILLVNHYNHYKVTIFDTVSPSSDKSITLGDVLWEATYLPLLEKFILCKEGEEGAPTLKYKIKLARSLITYWGASSGNFSN